MRETIGVTPDQALWNLAIFEWFFGDHVQGRPAFLSADEAALTAIAEARGWTVEDPMRSLQQCLRLYLETQRPFKYWVSVAESWKRSGSVAPPPFIHLLALTVIPVTELGDDNSHGAYYRPLFKALGIPDTPGRREDYRYHVPGMWGLLGDWLENQGGRYGQPTARPGSHSTEYLGYSRSQAIVRGVDRSAFIDFFNQVGYKPGERVLREILVARFETWATPSSVSERIRRALREPDSREIVAETLLHDLETWNGESRDNDSRSVLRVVPRLNATRRSLTLVLLVPPGFGGLRSDDTEYADAGDSRVFLNLSIALEADNRYQALEVAGRRLQLRHSRVHAFEEDPILGGYTAVDRMTEGRSAWLAVADIARNTVRFLEDRNFNAQLWPSLPGWKIYRDVRLDWGAETSCPDDLQAVAPPLGLRAELRGGLPLGNGRYRAGGAPDLLVPACPVPLEVRLNGELLSVGVPGQPLLLRLAERTTNDGQYVISVADQTLRFKIDSMPNDVDEGRYIVNVLIPDPPTLINTCRTVDTLIDVTDKIICGAQLSPPPLEEVNDWSWQPATDGWVVIDELGNVTVLPPNPPWLATLGQSSCHVTLDDLKGEVGHPVEWVGRVMSNRVHIQRVGVSPQSEVEVKPIAYFGKRNIKVDAAYFEDWLSFASSKLKNSFPFAEVPKPSMEQQVVAPNPVRTALDHMLHWCSDRFSGSIASFTDTFSWVEGGSSDKIVAYRALRVLNRLAHVEIDWDRQIWSIAPTTIVAPKSAGGLAFFTGRQGTGFYGSLANLIEQERIDAVLVEARQTVENPNAIYIRCDNRQGLLALSQRAGIPVIFDASEAVSRILPTIDRMVKRGRIPGGFERRKIEIGSSGPIATPVWDDSWNGSYEHDTFGPKIYSICDEKWDKENKYLVDRSTALWFALRQNKLFPIRYESKNQTLIVPTMFGLPLLHERSLVLATGLLPSLVRIGNEWQYVYQNISARLFEKIKETLS